MFDYNALYKPYEHDELGFHHDLSSAINWLKDTAKIDGDIIDQVVADTMNMISQGEKFELPCPCGCDYKHPNATIDHFMLSRAAQIKAQVAKSRVLVLQENEKQRVQARMKTLSKFEKDYVKMEKAKVKANTTWATRNIPTVKKMFKVK